MGGDTNGDYAGAREASAEEREFHAQQTNGSRPEAPRESAPPAAESPVERTEAPPRESRSEGSQAPLDFPPPPAAKPFVVWSSAPSDSPEGRRDE
jgi:hypothetical protein